MQDNLGKRMLEYRARHDIPAKELARRCGITVQTVYYIENGLQTPQKVTRIKIENVLKEDEKKK